VDKSATGPASKQVETFADRGETAPFRASRTAYVTVDGPAHLSPRPIAAQIVALVLALVLIATTADASYGRHHRHHRHRHHHAHVHVIPYHAELLEDADSGRVLYAYNADLEWPPASMAKMMLMLVAEDELKAGHVHLDDPVRISWLAAHTEGSRLGLRQGQVFPLRELMKAALIRSANDAAVAVAQAVCGSVPACVLKMNERAQELGMTGTHYGTVDGLPPTPGHDVDYTTALDLATLARTIIHQTDLLQWTGLAETPFDGGLYMLRNTNYLVGRLDGCDGLKTGFTMKAGFNLTATAMRGDMRLISVVLGAPSNPARFGYSAKLLDWGFDHFERVAVLKRGEPLPVHVQVESGPLIQPVAPRDIALVVPKKEAADLKLVYDVPGMISGPVTPGKPMGEVMVTDNGQVMSKFSAICPMIEPAATLKSALTAAGPQTSTEGKDSIAVTGALSPQHDIPGIPGSRTGE
jgi:D-alanyl-D-alanine carboxypeptidase (penicillin-binding protein 5/6)